MGERIEKIKEHVKENKSTYIFCGGAIAGFTLFIMRGRYEALVNDGAYGPKTADTLVTMRPLSFLSRQNNLVSVISRQGRGHPGYLIRSLDSNEYFSSQREAASVFEISETLLSKHLSGKIDNAAGYRFERINVTA